MRRVLSIAFIAFGASFALPATSAFGGEAMFTVYGGVRPQSTNDPAVTNFSRSTLGFGVDVAHLPHDDQGFVARAGAAFEWQGFCAPQSCSWPPSGGPTVDDRRGEFGIHGRLGYEWRNVGFEAGAVLRSESFVHPSRTALLQPDFIVRFGALHDVWFGIGGGAYNAPTIHSPGLYGLLHVALGPRAWLAFAGGVHEFGPWGDRPLWRFDGEGAGRIGRRWFIGGGGAIASALYGDSAVHGELRFFVGLEL